jgi:hypothetical protein
MEIFPDPEEIAAGFDYSKSSYIETSNSIV